MPKPRKVTLAEAPAAEQAADVEIVSIKGFDAAWRCRDVQFAVGQSYEIEGGIEACKRGFHAVEGHPLEVFSYYPPGGSRYAEVRQSGALSRDRGDSKVASAKISIVAEISLGDLIGRAVKWVMDRAKPEEGASATGDSGAASATGYRGAASATGDSGAASATGYRGAASATGSRGAASATGYRGAASATGDRGAASATGDSGAASATGYRGAASATGDSGAASASGWDGRVMGAEGCALFLVHRDESGKITHAWAGIAGRDGIKPLTWYRLGDDGKPVEIAA
jgi:hypothetical protein